MITENRKVPGPNAKEMLRRDNENVGAAIYIRFFPMVVKEGNGVYLKDVDNFDYLDFCAGWCVCGLGYKHPKIYNAIEKQLEQVHFVSFTSFSSPPVIKLAEKLVEMTPGSFKKKVWFGLTGSDAMECIFKLVPMASEKSRLITFQGSYHGSNWGAASLSGHQALAKFIGTPGITKIPYANCYRCPFKQEYPQCGMTCLEYIENNILQTISPPEYTAAIIAEPIQSDGGDIIPPAEFLPGLQRICKENDMYFVVDEVKVGVGRTGKWWACEHFDVTPDILAIGKPIASGMPLSAVVARAEILDTTIAGHLFTSSGHPICCATGIATLNTIEEENLLLNAEKIGNFMFKRLNEMKETHEIIGDVRGGKGLFLGVELVKDRKTKEPAAKETAKVVYSAWEMGLITAIVGIFENVIEITPPLIITEEQAEKGLNIFEEAIKRVERGEVPDEKIEAFAGW